MTLNKLLQIRDVFKWGTKGKNFDEKLQFIVLKDIENDHLENIIIWIKKYPEGYNKETLDVFETEKLYRLKIIRKQKLEKLIKINSVRDR